MLPVMNGEQFRAVQLCDPELENIPVIVCSVRPDTCTLAHPMGAVAALRKPVDLDRLLALVDRHCPRQ